MREAGWSHRMKRKSKDPYLKLWSDPDALVHDMGATFTDMDKKFQYLAWDEVVEL